MVTSWCETPGALTTQPSSEGRKLLLDFALAIENTAAGGFGIRVETTTGEKYGRLGDTDGFVIAAGMRAIGVIHLPPTSCKVSVTQCDSERLGENRDTSSRLNPERASESLVGISASRSDVISIFRGDVIGLETGCARPRLLADPSASFSAVLDQLELGVGDTARAVASIEH